MNGSVLPAQTGYIDSSIVADGPASPVSYAGVRDVSAIDAKPSLSVLNEASMRAVMGKLIRGPAVVGG